MSNRKKLKPKRSKAIPESSKKAVKKRSMGYCEAQLTGCLSFATDFHHVKSRARGGTNDPINLKNVCRKCHQKITDNQPGTEKFRTFSFQEEGQSEADFPNWKEVRG